MCPDGRRSILDLLQVQSQPSPIPRAKAGETKEQLLQRKFQRHQEHATHRHLTFSWRRLAQQPHIALRMKPADRSERKLRMQRQPCRQFCVPRCWGNMLLHDCNIFKEPSRICSQDLERQCGTVQAASQRRPPKTAAPRPTSSSRSPACNSSNLSRTGGRPASSLSSLAPRYGGLRWDPAGAQQEIEMHQDGQIRWDQAGRRYPVSDPAIAFSGPDWTS